MQLSRILRPIRIFPSHVGLQVRATIVVAVLVGLSVASSSALLVQLVEQRFDAAMKRQTLDVADRIEVRIATALAHNDRQALGRLIHDIYINEPRLVFVEVQDRYGRPLCRRIQNVQCWSHFDRKRRQSPDWYLEAESRPIDVECSVLPEAFALVRVIESDSSTTSHASSNLSHRPPFIGRIVLAVADSGYRETVQSIYATASAVFLLVMLISIPITLYLVRRLTRPIRRVAKAAEDFAAGLELQPISLDRTDEIGQLARSFNRMAERLSVTHRKLVQSNRELERSVDQRTRQLQIVNNLLRQEIETKNEFIRTVTHDLNAPLRNIAGMVKMIRKRYGTDLPDEVAQRIDRIEANVEMETTMLDDLLELSRLRTHPYKTMDVDLNSLLHQIRQALEPEMIDRGITCEIEDDFPIVHIEPRLVRQVFLNLIDNAVKYMGDRETRRINVYQELEDNWLVISVDDTGPGIPPEAQERIFDLFCRGATSTAREGTERQPGGRGVGLASVRTVVERWGGTIELESEPGVGSRFMVRIPADRIVRNACDDEEVQHPPSLAG